MWCSRATSSSRRTGSRCARAPISPPWLARLKPGDTVQDRWSSADGKKLTFSIRTTRRQPESKARDHRRPADPGPERSACRSRSSSTSARWAGRRPGSPSRSELLEKKGRDVDHGYKVAATGEIQLDGSVTRIGGIKQKTIGARKSQRRRRSWCRSMGTTRARQKRYAHGLADHPCEEFSTGVAGTGNAAAEELEPSSFRQD